MSALGKLGLGCLNALSHLPLGVHYFFSDVLLYPLVRHVVRYRVKVVRKNLTKAFPEKTEKERREIERRFYHYFCDLAVEIIKFHSISEDEIRHRYTFVGTEHLAKAAESYDFLCCYLSHYCNWEWAVSAPLWVRKFGINEAQIYHPMKNRVFDNWFLENRARFGAISIPMKLTVRRLMTLRQEMRAAANDADSSKTSAPRSFIFGCIADQLPKSENIHHRIQFLNQDTGVFTGTEVLVGKFKMATFYCKVTRPKRGYYQMEFQPMEVEKSEVLENVENVAKSEFPLTDEYFRRFEQDIKERPELWLWTHDRWKR